MAVTDEYIYHLRRMFVRNVWRNLCNLPEVDTVAEDKAQREWSSRFEALMRNRLLVGAERYGPLNAPGKPTWDRVGAMRQRLDAYVATGNLEALVDIANFALLEFEEGCHPKRYFAAVGVGALHVQKEKESDK